MYSNCCRLFPAKLAPPVKAKPASRGIADHAAAVLAPAQRHGRSRAKTIDNGCTEGEAVSAAAKVAELLDRYDLSLTDVEIREAPCERRAYETRRKKRIPLDDCIGAVANFCDCRVWRENNQAGETRYVFFGLRADIEVAHYLTELIDTAVRSELGRYKTTSPISGSGTTSGIGRTARLRWAWSRPSRSN